MTLFTKLSLSVLGGGSIVAGGYGTYELIRPKTIADQLKWEGKELLDVEKGYTEQEDKNGSGLWVDLFAKYKPSGNDTNTDKFIGDDASSISTKEKLKEKCKEVFVLPLTKENENNLKQAGFWCVKNSEKLVPKPS